ncbi:MAG TPA: bifunctional methylenetetrahydrofolate dehydrogenase/methenyltetrahydrofolate cyclohydrolase FolD [Gammaproteobacteria bacterium]|jgi:methylenetetrahydrofolate dehydrogenase (NADP+)/methenyltetrahydrofolate cyclohydrolase|nr:bifunctional methylenetetrahydrofolate dehydrogenase/methenyltetrahydrofolate cyclohydrolase FolD [Gammaproteobacteria bacterium]
MTANIIDGKSLAEQLKAAMKAHIQQKQVEGHRPPGLAVILIGEDPASTIYVRNKREACEYVGIRSFYHPLPATTTEATLTALIHTLNKDSAVDGILIQLPLPAHIDTPTILALLDPHKDVDGFHPYNIGRLAQRRPLLRPCTPYGVMKLLEHIQQPIRGKHAVVVGASDIVGRPMALELLLAGATVTVCHRATEKLETYVSQADILVSAVGNPGFIQGNWIKKGAIVIDVGITRLADGSLSGDIDYDSAKKNAGWITPVPGGVGPMTVAMLLANTLTAYDRFTTFDTSSPHPPCRAPSPKGEGMQD